MANGYSSVKAFIEPIMILCQKKILVNSGISLKEMSFLKETTIENVAC
jgi:hypothetical protein